MADKIRLGLLGASVTTHRRVGFRAVSVALTGLDARVLRQGMDAD